MIHDILIIGGSFAGQAAALQLGRARRRVLLVDAGRPRNRFARSAHGFLGQDGRAPAEIIDTASQQLDRYTTVGRVAGRAVRAVADGQGFRITLDDGREEVGRRVIVATGVRDILPEVPGLPERWGVSVLHCPYCHGYELDRGPIGVLARDEMALHQAMLVPDWGPTTLFTQDAFTPSAEQRDGLAERGVTIETTPVVELVGPGAGLEAVRLADGRQVAIDGLFVAPRVEQSSDLARQLGCTMKPGPLGPVIEVDGRQQTSVPGVLAAGDATNPMANATIAAAAGVMAAGAAHASLIFGLPTAA